MPQPEVSYYNEGNIQITNARAVLGGKTYAMANITSVTIGEKPANRKPGIGLAVLGLASAICGGAVGDQAGIAGIIGGLILLALGVVLAVMSKPLYIVKIGSAGGEGDALVSKDRAYIQKIVDAMNEAIINRG